MLKRMVAIIAALALGSGIVLAWAAPAQADGSADVSLILVLDPNPYTLGGDITATETVGNAGPDTAQAVIVTTEPPVGATLLDASAEQGSCETDPAGTPSILCEVGDLGPGTSMQIHLRFGTDPGTPGTSSSRRTQARIPPTPTR